MHEDIVDNLTGSRTHIDHTYDFAGGGFPEEKKSVRHDYNPDGTCAYVSEMKVNKNGRDRVSQKYKSDGTIDYYSIDCVDKNGKERYYFFENDLRKEKRDYNCKYRGKAVKSVFELTRKDEGEQERTIVYLSGERYRERQYKDDEGCNITSKSFYDSSDRLCKHTYVNHDTGVNTSLDLKYYKNDKNENMIERKFTDSSGKVYKHIILNEATGEEKDMLNSNEK